MIAMLAALVVRGRAEPPRRRGFEFDALEVSVERKIEIEPRLLAVGDHVQPGRDLIVHGRDHRVVLDFARRRRWPNSFEVLRRRIRASRETDSCR